MSVDNDECGTLDERGKMLYQYPLPPPPGPMDSPGSVEQVFVFCIAYFVLLSLALLLLPQKWMRRVIQVAFRLHGDSRMDEEVR